MTADDDALPNPWRSTPADVVTAADDAHAAVVELVRRVRPDWHRGAACAGADIDFYPHQSRRREVDAALQLCGRCPVMIACRRHVLEHEPYGDEHGVWGGMTPKARKIVKRSGRIAELLTPTEPLP